MRDPEEGEGKGRKNNLGGEEGLESYNEEEVSTRVVQDKYTTTGGSNIGPEGERGF